MMWWVSYSTMDCIFFPRLPVVHKSQHIVMTKLLCMISFIVFIMIVKLIYETSTLQTNVGVKEMSAYRPHLENEFMCHSRVISM